jgi:hypothetical protein
MRDDEKAVEHSEGQRRDGKEIHRGDSFPMIGWHFGEEQGIN